VRFTVFCSLRGAPPIAGPVIITELSSRAKATLGPGASKIHIYDQPLKCWPRCWPLASF